MRDLLFDASSVIYALKLGKLRVLAGNYVQWLTVYEVINALWKEVNLVKSLNPNEARELLNVFLKVLELMTVVDPHPSELEVLDIAVKTGLTAYDASYIVLAIRRELKLVTEDKTLRRKAKKFVDVLSLDQIEEPG